MTEEPQGTVAGSQREYRSSVSGDTGQTHTVLKGEHLSLIAKKYGIQWEKIWDDAGNSDLRTRRKTPNILHPGDVLVIPERASKEETGSTEQRHRFRLLGSQRIRVVIRDEFGKPFSKYKFCLSISGREDLNDPLTDDGVLEADVPLDVKKARLFLKGIYLTFTLNIGELNPTAGLSGVQQRLKNLGFYDGQVDGKLTPKTRSAIAGFQNSVNLPPAGIADRDTRKGW